MQSETSNPGPEAAAPTGSSGEGRWSNAFFGLAVFVGGAGAGVLAHYGLHRLMLTIEPFIYISF
jgi:hypothetical protein